MKTLGLRELEKSLNKLDVKIRANIMRRSLTAAMTPVVAAAKANIDKQGISDSGLLRKSIVKKLRRAKNANNYNAEIDVGIWKRAFYGLFQERGTLHFPARPFLRPALDENVDKVVEAFKKKMREGIVRGK